MGCSSFCSGAVGSLGGKFGWAVGHDPFSVGAVVSE